MKTVCEKEGVEPKLISCFPAYWDSLKYKGSIELAENGSLAYQWYYVTKYYGYNQGFVLSTEADENPWGFCLVIEAPFETSSDAKKYETTERGFSTAFYATLDGEECYIPIRWKKVVGKKGKKMLEDSKNDLHSKIK